VRQIASICAADTDCWKASRLRSIGWNCFACPA